MAAKFNQFGQWSLGADGGGTTLIKGINVAGPAMSNPNDKTDGLKGADVAKLAAMQIATGQLPVLIKAKPQPTNEELFGKFVVTEEMAKAAEKEWNNKIQDSLTEARKPIDHLNKPQVEGKWGYGKSFNQMLKGQLSEEELAKRNLDVTQR